MEQRTGFLTYEGSRVAYATVGEGPPLVLPAYWVSHVGEDWGYPSFRWFVESLAQGRFVVRYDRPGVGLSDRERRPETLTLEYEVEVLAALVDGLGLDRVALFGSSLGGPVGVAYAALQPERVERLVLYGTFAAGRSIGTPESQRAIVDLVRSSWGFGSRMMADVMGPSASPVERRELAAVQRTAASAATAAELLEIAFSYDVRDLLPTLMVPTLVVHREGDTAFPVRHGRELAALIAGAELLVLPGDSHPPWHGDAAALVEAIAPFPAHPPAEAVSGCGRSRRADRTRARGTPARRRRVQRRGDRRTARRQPAHGAPARCQHPAQARPPLAVRRGGARGPRGTRLTPSGWPVSAT